MDAKQAIKKLSGQIKVRVTEDRMGYVNIHPVSENVAKLIHLSNEYDGSSDIYLQSTEDIVQFLTDYPKSRFCVKKNDYDARYQIGNRWYAVNDGVIFLIDSWDFRHIVGGQSD